MHTDLEKHLDALHDDALMRALTLERGNYEEPFLQAAALEAERRDLNIYAYIDRVETAIDDSEPQSQLIATALELLAVEWPVWQLRTFRHYFDHAIAVQRELHNWTLHYYAGNEYRFSFFMESSEQVKDFVAHFLRIEAWPGSMPPTHDLDRWHLLFKTTSARYMQKVADKLREAGISFTIQPPVFSLDPQKQLGLRIAETEKKSGQQILHQVEGQVRTLYQQTNEAFGQQSLNRELVLYAQLVDYGLNNPAVFYNLGAVLYESGRYVEASESFIEALSLWISTLDSQVQFQKQRSPGGLGGMIGMVGMVVQSALPKAEDPTAHLRELPEYVEDAELWLEKMREHVPDNIDIIRTLAATTAVRNDTKKACNHYQTLLVLYPDDVEALDYLNSHEPL
ncbi:MAG: hypothetical protein ACKVJG_16200 [Candidatus Latescibacterota bacterium]